MRQYPAGTAVFEEPNVWRILFRLAPPVMLAQLIQALYNIVDSYFVGQYAGEGLTALSVIYPVQLIVTAIAVGTGVGVNTQISRQYAKMDYQGARETAGTGTLLALASWIIFTLAILPAMRPYVMTSASSPAAVEYAVQYGVIVCTGSLGVFLESIWSKVHQAGGNMKRPMAAQISGALTNLILDPILIFGAGPIPALGIPGAAVATVAGQFVAAAITFPGGFYPSPSPSRWSLSVRAIYRLGYPSIFMQALFTIYIVALNIILAGFSDEAVTVLGLYYKIQSFFFIPLAGLQTCTVPLLSYTYTKREYPRCQTIIGNTVVFAEVFMLLGVFCFEVLPGPMISLFSTEEAVLAIGIPAFRIIGLSFLPAVLSLMSPVFFQAIGAAVPSLILSLTRQIFCLIPIFWLLSLLGLEKTWMAFPLSELITGAAGLALYHRQAREWRQENPIPYGAALKGETTMKLITAIINRTDVNEVSRALTAAGFYFTKMSSTGGLLTAGNTTLLIGTEEENVPRVIGIIREHCSRREEPVPATVRMGASGPNIPSNVTVGGATVFVSGVEQFEKI